MCQTDLDRTNAGLWAWLPGQDRTVQWSAHLVHLHAAWDQIWRLQKLHVIHDVFALFITNFSNVGKAIAINHQFGNGLRLYCTNYLWWFAGWFIVVVIPPLILAEFTNHHPAICQELCTREIWPVRAHFGILSRSPRAEAPLPQRPCVYSLRTGKPQDVIA